MILNLIEAGFETNFTSLYWTYASGFPKAADVSKLADKRNGRQSEDFRQLGEYLKESRLWLGLSTNDIGKWFPSKTGGLTGCFRNWEYGENVPTIQQWQILKDKLGLDNRFDNLIEREEAEREIKEQKTKARSEGANFAMPTMGAQTKYINIDYTKPATPQAKRLQGAYAGFQPKPAVEIILTVMKPLSEKTFVDQALSNDKGVTWLDDCRIPYQTEDDGYDRPNSDGKGYGIGYESFIGTS